MHQRMNQISRHRITAFFGVILGVVFLATDHAFSADGDDDGTLWSLQPLSKSEVLPEFEHGVNPIDAFLARTYRDQGINPYPAADKMSLLRRISLDLIGLPPTVEEQERFLSSRSGTAYEDVVDRLLDSEQHGVRYARHWLDVMRYADEDATNGRMPAGKHLYLWRDWVINALNEDIPYDEFVRVQITGYRAKERTRISAVGIRSRIEPRPDDLFALGFLSRNATKKGNQDEALAINAVETISTTFMGMTVGCAKCHDHFYDPIEQQEFYAMKALFDPLVLRPVQLATAHDVFDHGRKLSAYKRERKRIETAIDRLTDEYHQRLYDERVEMLPPEIQAIIRKQDRSVDEQKIADEYYPVLRIDPGKIRAIMPERVVQQYDALRKELGGLNSPNPLPVFFTVAEDDLRRQQPRYVLVSGDAMRPDEDSPVDPGFPFATESQIDFRDGLREGFVDWLTDDENPLFARVVVNRIWHWHFGQGLHRVPSDFGSLGDTPIHPELLDWLAAEFIANGYSMKWLHRVIVTSDTYRRASAVPKNLQQDLSSSYAANQDLDPENRMFWRFPVQRLDAESIWDAIHFAANDLDLSIGGPSFSPPSTADFEESKKRRAAYMRRGFRPGGEIMPEFLRVFDVEDGRTVCPIRQQSVTAPQSLLLLNAPAVGNAAENLANRIAQQVNGDLAEAISLAYRLTLCRPPTDREASAALVYLDGNLDRLKHFCWLAFNLDEFIYTR